jgi:hypothetical protein
MVIEWGYVCATSSRFEVLREGQMARWFRVYVVNQIERFLRSKCAPFNCGCSCLVSSDAYRRVGTGGTVLWRARAREIAQAARRMIAPRRLLNFAIYQRERLCHCLKSTISATSIFCSARWIHHCSARSVHRFHPHIRRRCCGTKRSPMSSRRTRLPIFSEDAIG